MTAGAMVVDTRRLPARPRNPVRALTITARHVWVLHKRIFVRLFAAALACVLIVGAYGVRDMAGSAVAGLAAMVQVEIAEAGLAISEIAITGQTLTREQDIIAALGVEAKTSAFNFDAEAARARIEELPAVASATIRKVYPGRVIVTVTENKPVARWRVDGITFVVDAAGEQIGEDAGAWGELPLVIGDGAADDALVMIRALDQSPELKAGLVALSRIGDRRWDMIYETGLRVQLPEQGVAQALGHLMSYQRDYALLDRDVSVIDLRVPGLVAVAPTQHDTEAEDDAETSGTTNP